MKKSIFLFFAAILCAMTANAQWALMGTLTDWGSGKAMTVSGTTATCTVDLAGLTEYQLKVKTGNTWYGRNSTTISNTTTTNALNTSGGNVILKTTIPGTYTFSFDTGTKKLTVTYPELPAPHDITVRAQVPASWTNTITAWVWTSENGSGEEVTPTKDGDYYKITKNAGALYVIFRNGAGWNGNQNQTVDLVYTEDVCLQLNQSGTDKATATVIDCGAVAKDITVKAVVPEAWGDNVWAHVWETGASGTDVKLTEKEGNWYVYTKNCLELNIIFKSGEGWNNIEQTADIKGIKENTCYSVSSINKTDGKCNVTVEDCDATIEPEAKPEDIYTMVGADALLGTAWDLNNTENDMTKQADGSYVLVKENVDLATTGTYEYKVVKNRSWDWKGVNEGNNLTLTGVDVDGTYNVTFTLNKELNALTASLELVEAKKVIPECYVAGDESLTGQNWNAKSVLMTYDEATEVYTATLTAVPAGTHNMKVVYGGEWLGFDHLATPAPANVKEGDDKKIQFTLAEAGDVTVTYHATNGIGLTGNFAVPETKYYIAGTENLTGFEWKENGLEMTKEGDVYKHTFSEKAAGTYEFKITNGTWTDPWGFSNLAANYVGVEQGKDGEGNPNGNIKIVTEEAKNIIVIFDPANNKITLEDWEVAAPAEPVTVYFINSGNWAEVACHYWGGLNGSEWPGVQMDLTAETYEAEGWNVYKVTFPGDNTSCIFNDNKAEGATQTADLQVENGKYYCYANGIWYERLADVDPLDTRIYLKGDMNEWCTIEGWCDMFRKETVDGTVAYRTVYLEEANTTYEFKIEDAGTWLSNEGTMTKDNCTDWLFEKDLNNAKITTEYVGEYTFVWDMTTKKLSVVYPELVPEVMDLMVTDMVFDEDAMSFSGTDNTYGIAFNLVIGAQLEYGVYSLDASSTVNFGGTPFTDVTGMIAPDMDYFASATAQVSGFLGGTYYQLNVQMSAGGAAGVPVEILDGTASVDGAGELTISGNWDGDDVYVVAPGFNGVTYDCDEVWFYVGGTTWETASIIAFGPASITVDGNDVLVEGTVMSGMTGTNYDLYVIGTFPEEVTPDYTRTVASGSYGTICLPNGSVKVEGAKFYEVTFKKDGYIYADEVTTLDAGMPYIFHATSTEVKVYYNETTATAGSNNGVYGTFSDITDGDAGTTGNVLEGNYLLVAGPKVQKCAGNCSLAANRAYFVVSEISDVEQQSAPGRQRIALGCQDENQATGLDNITENGAVAPALQGTYDILGRQLSEPAVSGFYIINGKKVLVVK